MEGSSSSQPAQNHPNPAPFNELPPLGSAAPTGASAATGASATTSLPQIDLEALHNHPYYKISAMVRDLRPLFLEVIQSPEDMRTNKTSQEILKRMKIIAELSKEMNNNDMASSGKSVKLEHPVDGGNKGTNQDEEKITPLPQTAEKPSVRVPKPPKMPKTPGKEPQSSGAQNIPVRAVEGKKTGMKESGKQLEEGLHGTYVVGGSPIGWNFILYPGGDEVYYGVTKETALLRRASKLNV